MHQIWIKHYHCSSEKTEVPGSGGDSSDINTSDATNPLLAETDQMLSDEDISIEDLKMTLDRNELPHHYYSNLISLLRTDINALTDFFYDFILWIKSYSNAKIFFLFYLFI